MLGSVYVMEGSTLGGQVIGKALRSATWVPEGGLRYFNPYGPRTGAMWRNFCVALDAVSASAAQEVICGARDSFALLRDWLETTLSG
jgi:heme oxygenase